MNDAAPGGGRHWLSSPWLKVGLSVVLLVILVEETNISELAEAVSRARGGLVVAALLGYIISQVVSAIRWTMLSRALGFREPFTQFFGAYFTGMYMNLFAPSTVAGDIGRALFLAGSQKRRALAFTTVLADRGLGFVVLVCIGAFAILAQPWYPLPTPLYYGAWTIPPATVFGWFYGPKVAVRVLPPHNRWRKLVERDLAPYWTDYRLLIETSAVALVFHLLQIGTQVLLARALDLDAPASFFLIFVPVVNIVGMLPVSFSGIGIREGGYWFFLKMVGVDPAGAVALGLLSSVVVLLTGLSGGLVFLFWKNRGTE